jgi:hypothetical protein
MLPVNDNVIFFAKIGITHCKQGGTGVGDRFCPPIQGELRWRAATRGGISAATTVTANCGWRQ